VGEERIELRPLEEALSDVVFLGELGGHMGCPGDLAFLKGQPKRRAE
jgi:hypothetical protein